MLGVTQELITFAQFTDHLCRQVALAFQDGQDFEQRPLLQAQIAAAVNQLECLGDKFDLADTARPQLDIVSHAFAPHFLLDQLLHGAQRFNRGKIEVATIHKRA